MKGVYFDCSHWHPTASRGVFHTELLHHAALILHTLRMFAYVTELFIYVN